METWLVPVSFQRLGPNMKVEQQHERVQIMDKEILNQKLTFQRVLQSLFYTEGEKNYKKKLRY